MTTPGTTRTIGQLVAERPERGRLFEQLGIDYCCGGGKTLDEACAKRGLSLENVRAQLEAIDATPVVASGPDWNTAPLSQLADHIETTHHAFVRTELPRVRALVRKVAAVHGDRCPEMIELDQTFAAFERELAEHMVKEETILFPWIRSLESGTARPPLPGMSIDRPVACLMHEHDDAGEALAKMSRLTNGFSPPLDACGTWRVMLSSLKGIETDMHVHVHKENSILFPRAVALEASHHATA